MRGTEHAVVYSEYSGDIVFDEKDRCMMDNVLSDLKEKGDYCSYSTCAEKGTEAILNMNGVDEFWKKFEKQNEEDIKRISAVNPNMIKGEKNLLKVIVKNKDTGEQKCIDIPKERENDTDIRALKVGMTVGYKERPMFFPELVEIVKIVDSRPKAEGVVFNQLPYHIPPYGYNPWKYYTAFGSRRAGRATGLAGFAKDANEAREKARAKKEYQEKPYFLVRLDPIKGKPEGKENLEKIKFPCWVVYKRRKDLKHKIAMLVTGYPGSKVEYQLIDMMEQVGIGGVCTMWRDTDLKKLMERLYSWEVVKGESQLRKVGKVDV